MFRVTSYNSPKITLFSGRTLNKYNNNKTFLKRSVTKDIMYDQNSDVNRNNTSQLNGVVFFFFFLRYSIVKCQKKFGRRLHAPQETSSLETFFFFPLAVVT